MKTVRKQFEDAIASGKTVLVEFYADWCPHCQRMMPVVDELRRAEGNNIEIVQVEERESDLMAEYDIESFPTWLVFNNGELDYRTTGEKSLKELERMVELHAQPA